MWNPPGGDRGPSAHKTPQKVKLIGSSLLHEISARQALSHRVALTHHLPADDNCIASRRRLAVRISAATIYRLSEVPPVFQQREQNMPDRLRARVPVWASAGNLCSLCVFSMRCYALQQRRAQAASVAFECQVSCSLLCCEKQWQRSVARRAQPARVPFMIECWSSKTHYRCNRFLSLLA